MVATALIGSAIIGGGASIFSSMSAANAQKAAAASATNAQVGMYHEAKAQLSPYVENGITGENALMKALPGISAPIQMDEATLENTPGYRWNLAQGLKAAQNGVGARGLGASGAAFKGGETFATGLADSTYQTQFNNALLNKQMALSALTAPVQIGESAAANSGVNAINTGTNIGSNITGAGNAQAGAYINAGNAVGNTSNALAMALYGKQLGLY